MIKINLLPKTINQKRIVRNTAVLFGVLLVAVIAGGVTYSFNLRNQVQTRTEVLNGIKMIEQQVMDLEKERDDYKGKTKPIKDKLDFIKGVLEYNTKFAGLYEEVAKWTYEKVMYTSMSCEDGATVVIDARCKSLGDLGRYYMNMLQAGMFAEVTLGDVSGYAGSSGQSYSGPGYGGSEIGGSQADLAGLGAISVGVDRKPVVPGTGMISFKVTCKLDPSKVIARPSFAGAPVGGQPGQPGMPGGMPAPGGMPPAPGGMPPAGPMPNP